SSFTHLSFKAVTDRVREADIKVPTHSELIKNAAQWIADKKRRKEQIQQTKGSDSSVAQWIADKKRREEQTQQTKGSGSSVAETALSSTAYYEDDGVGEPEEHATQSTKPGDTTLPFEG